MRINLPELVWFGNAGLETDLPESWDVEYCPMKGGDILPNPTMRNYKFG